MVSSELKHGERLSALTSLPIGTRAVTCAVAVSLALLVACAAVADAQGVQTDSEAGSEGGSPSHQVVRVDSAASTAAGSPPSPPNGPIPNRTEINKLVDRYANQHRLDVRLVHAVIRAESGYNAYAVSPAGAIGLMQIMPATAAGYGVGSIDALFNASTNLSIGTRHLNLLIGRHGLGKAVMAYNAGEGALARHNGFVTYAETQRYSHRVLSDYLNSKGIDPYSAKAEQLIGIPLTPAMANGGAVTAGPTTGGGSAKSVASPPRLRDLSTLSTLTLSSQTLKAQRSFARDLLAPKKPMPRSDQLGRSR